MIRHLPLSLQTKLFDSNHFQWFQTQFKTLRSENRFNWEMQGQKPLPSLGMAICLAPLPTPIGVFWDLGIKKKIQGWGGVILYVPASKSFQINIILYFYPYYNIILLIYLYYIYSYLYYIYIYSHTPPRLQLIYQASCYEHGFKTQIDPAGSTGQRNSLVDRQNSFWSKFILVKTQSNPQLNRKLSDWTGHWPADSRF